MPIEKLHAAVTTVSTALVKPDNKIIVHCKAGVSRSAAVVVGHLSTAGGLDYNAAMAVLNKKRPFSILYQFVYQLQIYYHSYHIYHDTKIHAVDHHNNLKKLVVGEL